MVEIKDIKVNIALNYQGEGKCPIAAGSYSTKTVDFSLTCDYDESEDDSIVCLQVSVQNVDIQTIFNDVTSWAGENLVDYDLISSEVHCQVSSKKINSREAQDIKFETSAWQHELVDGSHTFVYFEDFEGSMPKLLTKLGNRVRQFWTVLDTNINL